jgi:LuxR family maltose regulon positive regulatory protein
MSGGNNATPGRELTDREIEVLILTANGASYGEIGEELGITKCTVQTHRRRIYAKLGAVDSTHAVAVAMATGILSEEDIKISVASLRDRRDEYRAPNHGTFTLENGFEGALHEWQLSRAFGRSQVRWVKLTGWLTSSSHPIEQHVGRTRLTKVKLPGRGCTQGHVVDVAATVSGSEYGTGIYVHIRWPLGMTWKEVDALTEKEKR